MFYKGKEVKGLGRGNSDLHGFGGQVREELSEHIPTDKGLKVLEVGTGFANTTAFLARTLPAEGRVWTLDPSAGVLRKAKKSLKALGLDSRVEFVHGSIDRTDFQDGYFDIVISVMTLHHLEDLHRALSEMTRVVSAHGSILLVDYGPRATHELKFRLEHRESDFFSPRDVVTALRGQGFAASSLDFGLWYLVKARAKRIPPGHLARAGNHRGIWRRNQISGTRVATQMILKTSKKYPV